MREAKRENTRCGLRPKSDKAASQKTRSPEGCDENGPAAALLLSHVSIQICSFVAPCRRPILIATPLNQSRTWCTRRYVFTVRNTLQLGIGLHKTKGKCPKVRKELCSNVEMPSPHTSSL